MTTYTPRIAAPLLMESQASKEATVNEAVTLLDAFVCPHFKDRDLSTPPGSPAQGDCYLVKATGTGSWTGQDGKIAIYVNTAWEFVTAKEGFLFWVDDENILILYDGATWSAVGLSTATFLQAANNLSDVANATTSRDNLSAAPKYLTIDTVSGTTYTFVIGDVWKHKRFSNGSAITVTVPANASVAFSAGTRIRLTQAGAGQITLTPDTGVTLNSRGAALKSAGQYAVFEIEKVGTNEWDVLGDVTT